MVKFILKVYHRFPNLCILDDLVFHFLKFMGSNWDFIIHNVLKLLKWTIWESEPECKPYCKHILDKSFIANLVKFNQLPFLRDKTTHLSMQHSFHVVTIIGT